MRGEPTEPTEQAIEETAQTVQPIEETTPIKKAQIQTSPFASPDHLHHQTSI